MSEKRRIEIFSAGCSCCDETVELVRSIACSSCEIEIKDMQNQTVAERARALGVRSVPAVAVDGKLAGCCVDRGPYEQSLRAAGIGRARA